MDHSLKMKQTHLLCSVVIFLQLFSSQVDKYWPGINHTIWLLLFYMKYFGAAILFVAAIGEKRNKKITLMTNKYIEMFYPFIFLFIFVEFIAFINSPVVSDYGIRYWTRFIAYALDKICVFVELIAIIFLCKEKAVDCLSTTLIINGLFTVGITILRAGIIDTVKVFGAVFGLVKSDLAMGLLEVHELSYCLGICIIYYLFQERDQRKKNMSRIIVMALLFILGGKRIAFGAIVVSGIFDLFVRKKGISKTTISVFGIVGVAICIGWVAILYNGRAMLFFSDYNINVMGRNILFELFINKTKFNISHTGWGLISTTKVLENTTREQVGNMVSIRGLHNDILRVYIECGFILGIVWYVLNLFYIPRKIFYRMGKRVATLYLTLTIFTFICYMTSNLENGFVYQTIYFLMPLFLYIKENTKQLHITND